MYICRGTKTQASDCRREDFFPLLLWSFFFSDKHYVDGQIFFFHKQRFHSLYDIIWIAYTNIWLILGLWGNSKVIFGPIILCNEITNIRFSFSPQIFNVTKYFTIKKLMSQNILQYFDAKIKKYYKQSVKNYKFQIQK